MSASIMRVKTWEEKCLEGQLRLFIGNGYVLLAKRTTCTWKDNNYST